ncbi:MAG: hypothetical protein G01um101493_164 [Microgenomates group bacterium Gr01-1014_93]|nr:MAG: hypothetical protein G01um101493_164 [Microgenomates group bacterium Gr01-1014_93]
MNQINWIEAYNSFTFFGALAAVAFAILLLVAKTQPRPTSVKRK